MKSCVDHLTFEERGSGQHEFLFSRNLMGRIFFLFLNNLQDNFFPPYLSAAFFFPQKGSIQVFEKMYLHLHRGYCSKSPDMELQGLKI